MLQEARRMPGGRNLRKQNVNAMIISYDHSLSFIKCETRDIHVTCVFDEILYILHATKYNIMIETVATTFSLLHLPTTRRRDHRSSPILVCA
jgi:hypothetical protein